MTIEMTMIMWLLCWTRIVNHITMHKVCGLTKALRYIYVHNYRILHCCIRNDMATQSKCVVDMIILSFGFGMTHQTIATNTIANKPFSQYLIHLVRMNWGNGLPLLFNEIGPFIWSISILCGFRVERATTHLLLISILRGVVFYWLLL